VGAVSTLRTLLVRRRVPIGFVCAALAYWLATPTTASILVGAIVALPGEGLRLWAAGHLDKGREITRSGPYRFVRHPLYLGSSILGAGFIIASSNWWVAALVGGYLTLALVAAIRSEEAALEARFPGGYSDYRAGRAAPVERRFSLARVIANREHRAVLGFIAGFLLLVLRRS
jgi:protein-S-isoprenylcysteine O-methyltransferase Ste14